MIIYAFLCAAICALFLTPASAQGQLDNFEDPSEEAKWDLHTSETGDADFSPRTLSWSQRNLALEGRWGVSDLVDNERCSPALRATIFTEVYKRQSAAQHAASMKYLWCKIDVGTESEAKKENIDISLVYEALIIDGRKADAFNKARAWRNSNCGDQQTQIYLSQSASEFSQTINTPVALRALETFETCISSSAVGTHCKAQRHSDRSVSLFINYIPDHVGPDGKFQAPKIVRAVVENAHVTGSPAERKLFKAGLPVPPKGITRLVAQENLSADVTFSVDLTPGFPACNSHDLLVRAAPSYVVSARVNTVNASKVSAAAFQGSTKIIHHRCNHVALPVPVTVCPSGGYVLDRNSFEYDAAWNPGNPPGRTKDICFGAISGSVMSSGVAGCVDTTVTILECLQSESPACEVSWKDGAGFGSTAIARMKGNRTEAFTIGPFDRTWPDADAGTRLMLETPGLPADASVIQPNWVVTITNKVSKMTTTLSQPGKQTDENGISAYYDTQSRNLTIFIPK